MGGCNHKTAAVGATPPLEASYLTTCTQGDFILYTVQPWLGGCNHKTAAVGATPPLEASYLTPHRGIFTFHKFSPFIYHFYVTIFSEIVYP